MKLRTKYLLAAILSVVLTVIGVVFLPTTKAQAAVTCKYNTWLNLNNGKVQYDGVKCKTSNAYRLVKDCYYVFYTQRYYGNYAKNNKWSYVKNCSAPTKVFIQWQGGNGGGGGGGW